MLIRAANDDAQRRAANDAFPFNTHRTVAEVWAAQAAARARAEMLALTRQENHA